MSGKPTKSAPKKNIPAGVKTTTVTRGLKAGHSAASRVSASAADEATRYVEEYISAVASIADGLRRHEKPARSTIMYRDVESALLNQFGNTGFLPKEVSSKKVRAATVGTKVTRGVSVADVERLIRASCGQGVRLSEDAKLQLQNAAQSYLEALGDAAYRYTEHAKRVTISVADLVLARQELRNCRS